jgi:branched-subunit amino acid transport protein
MSVVNKTLTQIETNLQLYFGKKAPMLPENLQMVLVKIAPYLAILGVIVTAPAILLLLGLGSFATLLSPLGGLQSVTSVPTMWLSILLLIPVVILEAMAIPGLFKRTMTAWKYLYWAQLIAFVSNILQFNIVGAVIGAVIGFYVLFQIRNHYK